LAGNFEATKTLFDGLKQAMLRLSPTKVPGHLANTPKVKLLKERGRHQAVEARVQASWAMLRYGCIVALCPILTSQV
jgi:hypothetical protein